MIMESSDNSDINNPKKNIPCIELRFLISSKVAGSVIGKNGENIKNLRRSHLARITISDNSGPERILSLEADIETILDILRQSLEKIEGGGQPPGPASGDNGDCANHVDLRMLVNQSLVGALIGRGGGRINELREKCNLKLLKIYQNVCPESTDRVVQMVGAMSPIIECIGKVVDMCKETPVKEPKINYDAQNFDSNMATHYGGWSQNPLRPDGTLGKGSTSLGFERLGFSKPPGNVADPYDFNNYNSYNNYRDMNHAFRPPQPDCQDLDSSREFKQTICLPHKMIGAIIGPGGSRIQQIRTESEAHITISSPDRNPQERLVCISGMEWHVRRAETMINECIEKYGK